MVFAGLAAVVVAGCFASHPPGDQADGGSRFRVDPPQGLDARVGPTTPAPASDAGSCDSRGIPSAPPLDLLFVVDDSESMRHEQDALAEHMPDVIRVLASGDLELDGRRDFPPVRDLHVAVVTTDMGVLGNDVEGCDSPHFGDDGRMDRAGSGGCRAELPSFLAIEPRSASSVEAAARDFGCLARVGTSGCGFEQPFEAALKALGTADATVRFHLDTEGHGDGANAGFHREDALLAIVFVTDEDDCSASDPQLFNGASYIYPEPMALRCAYERRALHPIERFTRGLRDLKPGHPERLFVGAIAGIPVDRVIDGTDPDAFAAVLTDPRMQIRRAGEADATIAPACTSPDGGEAQPSVRIVRLLSGLAPRSAVASICGDDFARPLGTLLTGVGRTLTADACARRATSGAEDE